MIDLDEHIHECIVFTFESLLAHTYAIRTLFISDNVDQTRRALIDVLVHAHFALCRCGALATPNHLIFAAFHSERVAAAALLPVQEHPCLHLVLISILISVLHAFEPRFPFFRRHFQPKHRRSEPLSEGKRRIPCVDRSSSSVFTRRAVSLDAPWETDHSTWTGTEARSAEAARSHFTRTTRRPRRSRGCVLSECPGELA